MRGSVKQGQSPSVDGFYETLDEIVWGESWVRFLYEAIAHKYKSFSEFERMRLLNDLYVLIHFEEGSTVDDQRNVVNDVVRNHTIVIRDPFVDITNQA